MASPPAKKGSPKVVLQSTPMRVKSHRAIVRDSKEILLFAEAARAAGALYFDTETTGLNVYEDDKMVGFSAHWRTATEGSSIYVPFRHVWTPGGVGGTQSLPGVDDEDVFENADMESVRAAVDVLLCKIPVPKIPWHSKFDAAVCKKEGWIIDPATIRCAMLLCLVTYAGRFRDFRLKEFVQSAFGIVPEDKNALKAWFKRAGIDPKSKGAMARAKPWLVAEYAMADCELVAESREHAVRECPKTLEATIIREYAVAAELQLMEESGCAVRPVFLAQQRDTLREEMKSIEAKFPCAPSEARGMAKFLKDEGVPLTAMTAGGANGKGRQVATDEKTLSKVDHPLVRDWLRWKELNKGVEFLESLLGHAEKAPDGRVHPSIMQMGARTGRTSQKDPNLQQMPNKAELGVRRAFMPPPGFNLWLMDYDQLQLRLVAILTGDERMTAAFLAGRDIHEETRKAIGTSDRRIAKNTNFAIVFGAGAETLAETINKDRTKDFVTEEQAQEFLDKIRAAYPGAREGYRKYANEAERNNGWVTIASGRRRWLDKVDLHMALNSKIQMMEADVTKESLIRLGPIVRAMGGYIQNFVHDEFQIVLPESVTEHQVWRLARAVESREHAIPVTVSVAKANPTWGEKIEVKKNPANGIEWGDVEKGMVLVVRQRGTGLIVHVVGSRAMESKCPPGALVLTADEFRVEARRIGRERTEALAAAAPAWEAHMREFCTRKGLSYPLPEMVAAA